MTDKSLSARIPQTVIRFPDIRLQTRDAHKLRGYFGNLFREHSPLLHNHFEDGSLRYAYPLVQYKVIDGIPMLVGFRDGADLLAELFLKIKELDIDGNRYPVLSKHIDHRQVDLTPGDRLHRYTFKTLWMALNQKNYREYISLNDTAARKEMLDRLLRNNILSFYKGVDYWTDEKILATSEVRSKETHFKGKVMLGFTGTFTTNALLPDYAGIGKSVARGFGTVMKMQ